MGSFMDTNSDIDNSMANISELFYSARMYHGLTQYELCSMLSVAQGTISKIEQRKMAPDLSIWFRFLSTFKVKDPYCFMYRGIEFDSEFVHNYYIDGGFRLAPEYSFKDGEEFLFEIKNFRPIYDHLMRVHKEAFHRFLDARNIAPELFLIHNHPITISLLDELFVFVDKVQSRARASDMVVLSFKNSYGRESKELTNAHTSKTILNLINESSKSAFHYVYIDKREYEVISRPNFLNVLNSMESKDSFLHYNLGYPLFVMNYLENFDILGQTIKTIIPGEKWNVKF